MNWRNTGSLQRPRNVGIFYAYTNGKPGSQFLPPEATLKSAVALVSLNIMDVNIANYDFLDVRRGVSGHRSRVGGAHRCF